MESKKTQIKFYSRSSDFDEYNFAHNTVLDTQLHMAHWRRTRWL